MKKGLALLMTISLAVSAAALPAMAEGTNGTVDQITSATVQDSKTGRNSRQQWPGQNGQSGQMPQMPGQNGQSGQMPQMPGQNGQSDQMPQAPGRNGQNNQQPQMPGRNGQNNQQPQMPDRNGKNGQMPQMPGQNGQSGQNDQSGQLPQAPDQNSQNGQPTQRGTKDRGMNRGNRNANDQKTAKSGRQPMFDKLLAEGVITQDVYDAIMNYLKEHAPQKPGTADTQTESGTTPDGSETTAVPAEGTEPPALPDGAAPAEGTEPPAPPQNNGPAEGEPENMEQQLLRELLDNGVITQEQYDLILEKITAAETVSNS